MAYASVNERIIQEAQGLARDANRRRLGLCRLYKSTFAKCCAVDMPARVFDWQTKPPASCQLRSLGGMAARIEAVGAPCDQSFTDLFFVRTRSQPSKELPNFTNDLILIVNRFHPPPHT
jgi:hypothetical protein